MGTGTLLPLASFSQAQSTRRFGKKQDGRLGLPSRDETISAGTESGLIGIFSSAIAAVRSMGSS